MAPTQVVISTDVYPRQMMPEQCSIWRFVLSLFSHYYCEGTAEGISRLGMCMRRVERRRTGGSWLFSRIARTPERAALFFLPRSALGAFLSRLSGLVRLVRTSSSPGGLNEKPVRQRARQRARTTRSRRTTNSARLRSRRVRRQNA